MLQQYDVDFQENHNVLGDQDQFSESELLECELWASFHAGSITEEELHQFLGEIQVNEEYGESSEVYPEVKNVTSEGISTIEKSEGYPAVSAIEYSPSPQNLRGQWANNNNNVFIPQISDELCLLHMVFIVLYINSPLVVPHTKHVRM